MSRIITLSTPESGITNGMELSFRAPCDCTDVTGISLNGLTYALVDASGNKLTTCSGYFNKDSLLTVIIDTDNKKASLLNPLVNTYTQSLGSPKDLASKNAPTVWARVKEIENSLPNKSDTGHKHTKSDITDFAHDHDDRYYTEDEVNSKLGNKSDTGHKHTKADVTDFAHTHTKSEITDFAHTHTKSQITDFPTSMPASDVYPWAKSPIKPTYSATEVGASPVGHNHDDRYQTAEIISFLLSSKSDTTHNHDGTYAKPTELKNGSIVVKEASHAVSANTSDIGENLKHTGIQLSFKVDNKASSTVTASLDYDGIYAVEIFTQGGGLCLIWVSSYRTTYSSVVRDGSSYLADYRIKCVPQNGKFQITLQKMDSGWKDYSISGSINMVRLTTIEY